MKRYRSRYVLIFALLFATAAHAEEIEEIEVDGIRSVPKSRVESTLELSPGEPWDKKRADRSIINLKALYTAFGFTEAAFTQTFSTQIWKIKVTEGRPTRLRKLYFSGQRLTDEQKRSLEQAMVMAASDIVSRERVEDLRRRTESALQGNLFRDIPFRLQDIYLINVTPTADTPPDAIWVDVEILLVPTERLSFGFRGNNHMTRAELLTLVEEQRNRGALNSLDQRVTQTIVERYRAMAFPQTEVQVRTYEREDARHTTFHISEGPRVKIDDIRFDGNNAFEEKELQRVFFESAPLLTSRGYYVSSEIEQAAEATTEWIRTKGYLSARVVSIHQTYLPHVKRMRILIYLYEGDRTLVRGASIQGLTVMKNEEVLDLLRIAQNNPLDLYRFTEGLEVFKQQYRNLGYLQMRVRNESNEADAPIIQYSLNNRFADIHLDVDEGPQIRAGTIAIEGNELTDPTVVRRELTFDEGDVLQAYKIPESESRIRRLGIFTKVQIQLRDIPGEAEKKSVLVILGESAPGLIAGGVGVRNDLGLRAFGNISYSNLWRQNHTLSFSGSINRRFEFYCRPGAQEEPCFFEFQFRVGYAWPWFVFPKVNLRPELSVDKRRYIQFDSITTTLSATLERALPFIPGLSATFTYSLERTKQFNAASSIDNKTLTIGAITPSVKLDRRDDPLSPNKGFLTTASFELASALLGSQTDPFQVGYTKFQFRTDAFVPILPNMIWYLSFRTGYERNNIANNSDGIPLIKQFALGGAGSLRGFRLQEVNVQDVLILGSLAFVNYRTQVDFPITQNLRVGPFVDAGALMIDSFQFLPDSMRYGVGLGLHYQTPIGPFNIDWGFKVAPRPGEDTNRIDITIGLI